MNEWISAAIAAGGGLVIGTALGRITQSWLSREKRPEVLRSVAVPISSLVFSVVLIAGLMTSLGFVNEEALDQIPKDLVDFLPNLLGAAIVVIGANVVGQLARNAISRTVAQMPGSAARNAPNITRLVILVFGGILAAAQLGVDTTVINITVAAALFSIGLSGALMVGLGSRKVSGEIAAGRAIRHLISPGDEICVDGTTGTVVSLASVAVELDTADGTIFMPHSLLLEESFSVVRTQHK